MRVTSNIKHRASAGFTGDVTITDDITGDITDDITGDDDNIISGHWQALLYTHV